MPTFIEIQQKLIGLRHRREVLLMLVNYIDENFRSNGGTKAKLSIKGEDGLLIPEQALEETVQELTEKARALSTEIFTLESQPFESPAPPAPPAAEQAPQPTPRRRRRRKAQQEGEST